MRHPWFSTFPKLDRSHDTRTSKRRRARRFETLEARQLLARDLWHNPLWPLDSVVDQYGVVAPINALVIINELNDPVYSDPRTQLLPTSLPGNAPVPYFYDVSCDGYASPINALLVINELNEPTGTPGWSFTSDGGTGAGTVVSTAFRVRRSWLKGILFRPNCGCRSPCRRRRRVYG